MPYCHNCGTQLGETVKFCPSCGAAYQGSQAVSQGPIQATVATLPPPVHTIQSAPASHVQQNVVVMGKAKSVGAAFILAFFFGPLGLLYASVIGGIVMFIIGLISFFVLPIIGYIIVHIGCVIWACVAADQANQKLRAQGQGLINNQFR